MSAIRRVFTGSFAALGALVVIVTLTPLVNWWATWLAGPWNDPQGEVLIVPGASVVGDGMIGYSSYWRVVYAARAWSAGHFREVILTGDIHITDPMRRFLVAEGVPDAAIRIEGQSLDTHENAVNTARMLAPTQGTAVLLTSDYHMFRAYRAFRKAGANVLPRPFPDARKRGQSLAERWPVFLELCRETTKIAYYAVRGWI